MIYLVSNYQVAVTVDFMLNGTSENWRCVCV